MGLHLWMPYLNAKKGFVTGTQGRGAPQSIAGRAELARYTLTRALITGGNATLTPGCVLVALTGLARRRARAQGFKDFNDNKDIKDAPKKEGFTLVVHA